MATAKDKPAAKTADAPEPDRWSVAEHARAAESLYGQPPWLIHALMVGCNDPEGYTKAEVQEKIDAYNKRPIYGGEQ